MINDMTIDKHIVVKEVGALTYSEISPIYKANSKMWLDDQGYCHEDIVFNHSLEVKWKYLEISIMEEVVIVKKVELEYDFGMPHEFFPEQEIIESPEYWKYRNIDLTSSITDVVKRYVEDQVIFSLRRNPCELKPIHWAVRGWLKERVSFPWHNQLVKI